MRIPLRYQEAKYEDVPQSIKEPFEKMRETRKGLYIHGGVGTGKTHITYALYSNIGEVIKVESEFWNTTELFRELRAEFNRDNYQKQRVDQDLLNFRGVLFLDDIGAEKISEWVAETFYLIVNHRYNEMIPTIFTSNLSMDELSQKIGDRTTSRIAEMCDIIELTGNDKRV